MPETRPQNSSDGDEIQVENSVPARRIAQAEIDIQVSTAKEYPRSIAAFKSKALSMATLDEETAESCFYSLPRDGKQIEGPSARLAEIVASAWGNIRAEARVISEDDRFVYSEAVAWDLETNVAIKYATRRRITNKHGRKFSDDMVAVTANAASSIALRNAVFKVVPMAYVRSIYEAAKQTAIGDAESFAARRSKLVEQFQKMGIMPDRLLASMERASIDDLTVDDCLKLKGMRTAIKDGELSLDDAFPPAQAPQAKGVAAVAERIRGAAGAAAKENGAKDARVAAGKAAKVQNEAPKVGAEERAATATRVAELRRQADELAAGTQAASAAPTPARAAEAPAGGERGTPAGDGQDAQAAGNQRFYTEDDVDPTQPQATAEQVNEAEQGQPQTNEPSFGEQAAIRMSEVQGCSVDQAAARLAKLVPLLYKAGLSKLSPAQQKDLMGNINSGQIKLAQTVAPPPEEAAE